jgi:ubiquinone/menaquinone biosynthesis C-methylase UbiE
MTSDSPHEKFTDRASQYAAHRPAYADAAIDRVLAGLPGALVGEDGRVRAAGLPAADVGAGTGISSRQLAERGCRVFAIEPNAAMRDVAEPHDKVTFIDAAAERTTLPDNDVVLVLCAQAFHWFDAETALAEFVRILHPVGRVALMWNVRDDETEFMRSYGELITRHAIAPISTLTRDDEAVMAALERRIAPPEAERFENAEAMTFDELAGRALSASYTPNQGYARETFIAELAALFDEHAAASPSSSRDPEGTRRVIWRQHTQLYIADASG